MINLNNVSLNLGSQLLFENVNLTLFDRHKIGLVGANGSGKTSFFKLLIGQYQPDSGKISIPPRLRIAHLAQDVPPLAKSALEFVLDGDMDFRRIEKELDAAQARKDYDQVAVLHQQLSEIDGYSAAARAAKLLHGLGFDAAAQQKPVKDFSGGWRTRLNLAQTLMRPADMLLLDEPTNHLDLEAILWLEKWLQQFQGTLLIISHDRVFLDNCVNQIIHIEDHKFKMYSGNYSNFETLRAEQLALQQKSYEKQQKKMAHLMSYVNRFRAKASKAKQAQSRLKALEKMEVIAAVQADSPFYFEFPETGQPPNPLLTLTNVQIAYQAGRPILQKINLQIRPGMRAGLLGVNGAGKSTLVKLLAGELKPAQGSYDLADKAKIGYYAQHQIEQLNFEQSPFWHLQTLAPSATPSRLRQFLGGFGFSGDKALAAIDQFSGGEKARLALALLVWQAPNLLLLDEPTNHLDLEMRNALTMALQSYTGALILISHDRYLLETTTDELFLVADHQVKPFDGDLSDYQKWLFTPREHKPVSVAALSKADQRKLEEDMNKLEKKLEKLHAERNQLETELADSALYQTGNASRLAELMQKQKALANQITDAESLWLQAFQKLESSQSRTDS